MHNHFEQDSGLFDNFWEIIHPEIQTIKLGLDVMFVEFAVRDSKFSSIYWSSL